MDDLLLKLLGASFSEGEVLQRQSLGNIIHIFSHIRMTLLVERLVLKVCSGCSVTQSTCCLQWCLVPGISSCREGGILLCLSHERHQVTAHQCAAISMLFTSHVRCLS